MNEVDVLSFDRGRVVVEGVKRGFMHAPVVVILPVGDQLLEVRAIRPVGPGVPRRVPRPPNVCQPAVEVGERVVADMELKRIDARLRETRGGSQYGPCASGDDELQDGSSVDRVLQCCHQCALSRRVILRETWNGLVTVNVR